MLHFFEVFSRLQQLKEPWLLLTLGNQSWGGCQFSSNLKTSVLRRQVSRFGNLPFNSSAIYPPKNKLRWRPAAEWTTTILFPSPDSFYTRSSDVARSRGRKSERVLVWTERGLKLPRDIYKPFQMMRGPHTRLLSAPILVVFCES